MKKWLLPLFKSTFPFLLLGIIFSAFFFQSYFEDFSHFIFYILMVLLHYISFLTLGIVIHLFSKKEKLNRIFIQFIYGVILLSVIVISVGSRFGINHWHAPINLTLLSDFFFNIRSYASLFPTVNYYFGLSILLIFLLGFFRVLNIFHPYNLQVIQKISSYQYNARTKIKIFFGSIFCVFIFYFSSNSLTPLLIQFKQEYVMPDPLAHFYYSSILRQRIKIKVNQSERELELNLKEKYPLNDFPKPSKNVILITIDALRSDYLPCYGFPKKITPFLDSFLARKKHALVEHPLAVCNYTVGGTASILDASLSDQIGIKKLGLQNYLAHWGYQNNFILSGNHAGFGYMDLIFGNTLNYYKEGTIARGFVPNDDHLVPHYLQEYFEQEDWKKESNFFWIHLMSVHVSSKKEPIFKRFQPSDISAIFSEDKVGLEEKYVNSYMNGILQMDDFLRQVLTQLEEKTILENATIIITSDHGESLGEEGNFSHANTLNHAELNIPFIIIDEDLPDFIKPSFGSQLDVAPTIVDLLDLPKPDDWDGHSVLHQKKHSIVPLSSAEKDEFGVAIPFKNTWLAFIKKDEIEHFEYLDDSLRNVAKNEIPKSLQIELKTKWDEFFK